MGAAFNVREEEAVKTAKHGYDRKPSKEETFVYFNKSENGASRSMDSF